ncbi:MFS transporter [Lactiplantibacillus sp. WILCCON 0030]|uniref:MFS transporter n=1 Tax=Lactiplantibacillus brownii TaxID=3069269 RepID=A0ABU1A5E4_9LACO|nr:MFS transporter [Lactiplantibacillus brownii]MDQ7936204.1 MFS transporter [Lactiplantibacillus brownii]
MLRNISLISATNILFNLSVTTLNFVFGLYFFELTGSAFIFGTLTIIGPIVSLLLTPIMANIVDRINHKKILIYSQLLAAIFLLIYELFSVLISSKKLLLTYVLMILIRICEELFSVTLKATVTQLTIKNNYQKFNSLIQSTTATANILGPILGGIAYSLIDINIFTLGSIALLLTSILFTRHIYFEFEPTQEKQEKINFLSVIDLIKHRPEIFSLIIIAMFLNFFASSINIGLPVLILQKLKLSKLIYSFLESLTSIAMLGGGMLLVVLQIKDQLKSIYTSMLAFTIILVLFGIPLQNFGVFITISYISVLVLCFGLIIVFANTAMTTYLQDTVPTNQQGGVYSIINAISQLFVPLGALGYGLLFDKFDYTFVFFISGISAFSLVVPLLLRGKKTVLKGDKS